MPGAVNRAALTKKHGRGIVTVWMILERMRAMNRKFLRFMVAAVALVLSLGALVFMGVLSGAALTIP